MRETDTTDDTRRDLQDATARAAITLGEAATGLTLQREQELAAAKQRRDDARHAAVLAFQRSGRNPTEIAQAMRHLAQVAGHSTAGLSNNNIRGMLALLAEHGGAYDRAEALLAGLQAPAGQTQERA